MIRVGNLISSISQYPVRLISYLGSVIATALNSLRGIVRWIRPDQKPTEMVNQVFHNAIEHLKKPEEQQSPRKPLPPAEPLGNGPVGAPVGAERPLPGPHQPLPAPLPQAVPPAPPQSSPPVAQPIASPEPAPVRSALSIAEQEQELKEWSRKCAHYAVECRKIERSLNAFSHQQCEKELRDLQGEVCEAISNLSDRQDLLKGVPTSPDVIKMDQFLGNPTNPLEVVRCLLRLERTRIQIADTLSKIL